MIVITVLVLIFEEATFVMLEMVDKPIDAIGNVAVGGVLEIDALEHWVLRFVGQFGQRFYDYDPPEA